MVTLHKHGHGMDILYILRLSPLPDDACQSKDFPFETAVSVCPIAPLLQGRATIKLTSTTLQLPQFKKTENSEAVSLSCFNLAWNEVDTAVYPLIQNMEYDDALE